MPKLRAVMNRECVAVCVTRPCGSRIRQGRVYCNATLRYVRATTLSVENAISIAYSACVYCLRYSAWRSYIVVCGLCGSTIFFHIFS